jgi:cobalamin biosynthesis protein CobT
MGNTNKREFNKNKNYLQYMDVKIYFTINLNQKITYHVTAGENELQIIKIVKTTKLKEETKDEESEDDEGSNNDEISVENEGSNNDEESVENEESDIDEHNENKEDKETKHEESEENEESDIEEHNENKGKEKKKNLKIIKKNKKVLTEIFFLNIDDGVLTSSMGENKGRDKNLRQLKEIFSVIATTIVSKYNIKMMDDDECI